MSGDLYYVFAMMFKEKLYENINGAIRYDIYRNADAVTFKVNFKDFKFDYTVYNIQDILANGKMDDVYNAFTSQYKRVIYGAFFKTDERKRREELRKYGIEEELLV